MTVFGLLVDCFDDLEAGALHGLHVLARGQQLGCCIVSFDACPNVLVVGQFEFSSRYAELIADNGMDSGARS